MASLGRAIAVAPLTLALACAGLVGLEDPAGPGAAGSDAAIEDTGLDAEGSTNNLSPPIDASVVDAPVEAAACTRLQIGQTCAANDACCSGQCKMDRRCANSCIAVGKDCITDLRLLDCCVGTYCSNQTHGTCAACRASGTPAEMIDGKAKDYSCCSAELNGTNCR